MGGLDRSSWFASFRLFAATRRRPSPTRMNRSFLGQQVALKHAVPATLQGRTCPPACPSCVQLGRTTQSLSDATKVATELQAHVARLDRELQARETERKLMMASVRQSEQRAEQALHALHAAQTTRAHTAEEEVVEREALAQAREARAVQAATLGERARLEEAHRLRQHEQAVSAALREALGRAEAREAALQAALRETKEQHRASMVDVGGGADESAALRRRLLLQEEQVQARFRALRAAAATDEERAAAMRTELTEMRRTVEAAAVEREALQVQLREEAAARVVARAAAHAGRECTTAALAAELRAAEAEGEALRTVATAAREEARRLAAAARQAEAESAVLRAQAEAAKQAAERAAESTAQAEAATESVSRAAAEAVAAEAAALRAEAEAARQAAERAAEGTLQAEATVEGVSRAAAEAVAAEVAAREALQSSAAARREEGREWAALRTLLEQRLLRSEAELAQLRQKLTAPVEPSDRLASADTVRAAAVGAAAAAAAAGVEAAAEAVAEAVAEVAADAAADAAVDAAVDAAARAAVDAAAKAAPGSVDAGVTHAEPCRGGGVTSTISCAGEPSTVSCAGHLGPQATLSVASRWRAKSPPSRAALSPPQTPPSVRLPPTAQGGPAWLPLPPPRSPPPPALSAPPTPSRDHLRDREGRLRDHRSPRPAPSRDALSMVLPPRSHLPPSRGSPRLPAAPSSPRYQYERPSPLRHSLSAPACPTYAPLPRSTSLRASPERAAPREPPPLAGVVTAAWAGGQVGSQATSAAVAATSYLGETERWERLLQEQDDWLLTRGVTQAAPSHTPSHASNPSGAPRASGGSKSWISFDERVPVGGKRASLPPPRVMADEPRAMLSDALSPSWRCSPPPPSRRVGTNAGALSPGGIGSPSFSLVSPLSLNAV